METLNKIMLLLKEQHKKQIELCDYIGIKKNAFTNWKNGANNSYYKHIGKIAEFFDVSTDYLLGVEIKNAPTKSEGDKNIVKIAGRDGSLVERTLTDAQLDLLKKMIEQLPDAENL